AAEAVGADDRFARIVAVAVAPGCRLRRVVADQGGAVATPQVLKGSRCVAAEVARISPQGTVLVEVLRREDVDRQGFDTGRCGTTLGAANEFTLATLAHAAAHSRAGGRVGIGVGKQWRATAHAAEVGLRILLRLDTCREHAASRQLRQPPACCAG